MAEEKKPAPKQRKKPAAPKQEAPKQEPPKQEAQKPAAEKPAPKVEKKPEVIKDNSDQSLVGKTIECFLGSCLVEEIRSAGGNSSDAKHDIVKVRRESDNTVHILRRRQL
jgi:outer membrane biosynthesis protein TonB